MDIEVDWQVKGAPVVAPGTTVRDLVAHRPSLFDGGFLAPVMVLKNSALESNIATMREFCRGVGVELAPHGKTHMSPQLADRQLAAGAWGVTVATIWQARVYRAAGVQRLFMANELVDPAGIRWLAGELAADPQFEFLCYVDSVDGVRLLESTLADSPVTIDVLVEFGPVGARTGVRTVEQARAVADAVTNSSRLRLVGVSGYEGGFGHGDTPDDDVVAAVRGYLRDLRAAGEAIAGSVPADVAFIASAGGSVYFDLVAEELTAGWRIDRPVTVIVRSGCYLTHDCGAYLRQTPFGRSIPGSLHPALQVWGQVLSIPEPDLALVSLGRRDVSFDIDMPVVQEIHRRDGSHTKAESIVCSGLNDQHAYVHFTGEAPFRVGDWVGMGISHPCTAFDKWKYIAEVDDDYRVIDYVRTYF